MSGTNRAKYETKNPVVRAMNVLNRGYFADDDLERAVGHVRNSLEVGGFFLTGSNEGSGSRVNGAVYERSPQGFHRLYVSGAGSQIDAIVMRS